MNKELPLNQIQDRAGAIARAVSAADVFKAFLEASSIASPRSAIFLIRKTEIHGWGSFGYGTDVAQAQRAWRGPREQAWFDEMPREGQDSESASVAPGDVPDFGQPAAEEAIACPLFIDGKLIAVLLAERAPGDTPWFPAAIGLLSLVAELRLALCLAHRRATATESADAKPTPRPSAVPANVLTQESTEEPAPDLEPARRYARLVATDIRLYNEEAVIVGRRNGDLSERIGEHLDRGKETFLRRHSALGPTALELLHEAYVQVLAAGDESLIPQALLD